MKILILDDRPDRHIAIELWLEKQRVDTAGIYHAFSYSKFVELYQQHKPDTVFLDHDLGMSNETGMDTVDWLVENEQDKSIQILIHSFNPPAREAMLEELQDAGFNNSKIVDIFK